MTSTLRVLAAGLVLAGLSCARLAAQPLPGVPGGPPVAPAGKSVQTTLPTPSASARDLFSRYKDRLVQVRVLLNSANEQSSLGSGFVVRNDSAKGVWLLTNYHVVSSLAIDPEKYRLELRPTSERTVKATLVAVDVIHDLAVLRADVAADVATTAPPWPVFVLRDGAPAQGERLFSLGNPLELGFLISEGIYNGLVESRVYEQMLFSGAINAGMSGGPAIDEAGRVIGVNVAVDRRGQLLSYLVPVRYARDLLESAWQAPSREGRKEWRSEIGRQLLVHQDFVAGKLLKDAITTTAPTVPAAPVAPPAKTGADQNSKPARANSVPQLPVAGAIATAKAGFATQTLAGRSVPTLDGSLTKCWAGGREGERLKYQRDSLSCTLRSELFVRGDLYTGSLAVQHVLLRNDKLAAPQFFAIRPPGQIPAWFGNYGGREMTPDECRDDYLRGATHVYRVSVCLKGYRKFDALYDYTVTATQVDDSRERLVSKLLLNGVSFDNGQRLGRMFLERLQ